MGFKVSDADILAHNLMTPGMPVYRRIVDQFGKQVLTDSGEISRPTLGRIVFNDETKRLQLNDLIHPAVRDALEQWIAERHAEGERAAAQVPLLYESGMETLAWDTVLCVSSSEALVMKRLLGRGLDRKEALKRIRVQMPLPEKERLADRVIPNLGTIQELETATRKAVEGLLAER